MSKEGKDTTKKGNIYVRDDLLGCKLRKFRNFDQTKIEGLGKFWDQTFMGIIMAVSPNDMAYYF